jgi:hypothetical protein
MEQRSRFMTLRRTRDYTMPSSLPARQYSGLNAPILKFFVLYIDPHSLALPAKYKTNFGFTKYFGF